jgi:hypothetical protein
MSAHSLGANAFPRRDFGPAERPAGGDAPLPSYQDAVIPANHNRTQKADIADARRQSCDIAHVLAMPDAHDDVGYDARLAHGRRPLAGRRETALDGRAIEHWF